MMSTSSHAHRQSDEVESFVMEGVTTFINPYSYLVLRRTRPTYIMEKRFRFGYDGTSLALLARIFVDDGIRRTSFDDTSLAPRVFRACARDGLSVALVGSAPGVSEAAARLIAGRYPGLRIAFTHDGYFDRSAPGAVHALAMECDVVICSMGTPYQEDFFLDLAAGGWSGVGYTCGGYLDQLVEAGGDLYYPKWMDALNLRWLYRIYREPRRLLMRYLRDYPLGIWMFIRDRRRLK